MYKQKPEDNIIWDLFFTFNTEGAEDFKINRLYDKKSLIHF